MLKLREKFIQNHKNKVTNIYEHSIRLIGHNKRSVTVSDIFDSILSLNNFFRYQFFTESVFSTFVDNTYYR